MWSGYTQKDKLIASTYGWLYTGYTLCRCRSICAREFRKSCRVLSQSKVSRKICFTKAGISVIMIAVAKAIREKKTRHMQMYRLSISCSTWDTRIVPK